MIFPDNNTTTIVRKMQITQVPDPPYIEDRPGTLLTPLINSSNPQYHLAQTPWQLFDPNSWALPTESTSQYIDSMNVNKDRMKVESNKMIELTPLSPKLSHTSAPTNWKSNKPRQLYSKIHTCYKVETQPDWCTGTLKVRARQRLHHFDSTL